MGHVSPNILVGPQRKGLNWLLTEDLPSFFQTERLVLSDTIFYQNANIYGFISQSLILWTKTKWCQTLLPKEDRLIDPFRPTIEPNGFPNERELLRKNETIKRFKQSIELSDYLFSRWA